METTTLKTMIVELRDSGLTYQQISDYLKTNYGVDKTRQAVSGMYNRAKAAQKYDDQTQRVICDIVNLYCILDSAVQVTETFKEHGNNISYQFIRRTVESEKKYIESVKSTIVANIEMQLDKINSISELEPIEYKGIKITAKRQREYIEAAYASHIRSRLAASLVKMYNTTSDKQMVKSVASSFGVRIGQNDLNSEQ
jgi:hypothetical protein